MDTIKSAVVVILLLAILYGAYVVLTDPNSHNAETVGWDPEQELGPPAVEFGGEDLAIPAMDIPDLPGAPPSAFAVETVSPDGPADGPAADAAGANLPPDQGALDRDPRVGIGDVPDVDQVPPLREGGDDAGYFAPPAATQPDGDVIASPAAPSEAGGSVYGNFNYGSSPEDSQPAEVNDAPADPGVAGGGLETSGSAVRGSVESASAVPLDRTGVDVTGALEAVPPPESVPPESVPQVALDAEGPAENAAGVPASGGPSRGESPQDGAFLESQSPSAGYPDTAYPPLAMDAPPSGDLGGPGAPPAAETTESPAEDQPNYDAKPSYYGAAPTRSVGDADPETAGETANAAPADRLEPPLPEVSQPGGGPASAVAEPDAEGERPRRRVPAAPVSAANAIDKVVHQARELISRGDYRRALESLSLAYQDLALPPDRRSQLLQLLDPLAGKVIYSREHLLAAPHQVRQGEDLFAIAEKYRVPWQLLQNINGLASPRAVDAGTELKIVPGPFRAVADLSDGELTLFVDDLYAGRFPFQAGQDPAPVPGQYRVQSKQEGRTYYTSDGRTIPANAAENPYGKHWIDLGQQMCLHGSSKRVDAKLDALGCLRFSAVNARDLFGILSQGSDVEVRR